MHNVPAKCNYKTKNKSFTMWKAMSSKDHIITGDKLRRELFLGDGQLLWTEYEVIKARPQELLVQPIATNGHLVTKVASRTQKITYHELRHQGARIWVKITPSATAAGDKNSHATRTNMSKLLYSEQLVVRFCGLHVKLTNPTRTTIFLMLLLMILMMLLMILPFAFKLYHLATWT